MSENYFSNLFEKSIKREFIEIPFHICIPHCEFIETHLVIEEITLSPESDLSDKVVEIAKLLEEKMKEKGEGYSFFHQELIYRPHILSGPLKLNALLVAQCACSKENVPKIVEEYQKNINLAQASNPAS